MFYIPLQYNNTVAGIIDMMREISKPDFVMVEIGSFSGVSTETFANFCKEVHCVDLWTNYPAYTEITRDRLELAEKHFDEVAARCPNVIKHKTKSLDAVSMFADQSLDMVYIDGAHDEASVEADILAWTQKVKTGGFVCGHDIDIGGVQWPVHRVIGKGNYKSYSDTSWAHQVRR